MRAAIFKPGKAQPDTLLTRPITMVMSPMPQSNRMPLLPWSKRAGS